MVLAGVCTVVTLTGVVDRDVASAVEATPPVKIMPLGDSITMGIGSATLNSYRGDLYNRLIAAGVDADFVGSARDGVGGDTDHEGHSGWTINKIAAEVENWLAEAQPDVVLLHIGTNDMRHAAPAALAPLALDALIDQILAARPGVHLFVAKITGAKAVPEQRRIDAYNARIPNIVASKGPYVHVVDQSTVDSLDIRDNLHPNDFGYAKMSWNWHRALQKVLNRSDVPWPIGSNPYLAQTAYRCLLTATYPHGSYVGVIRCEWWFRRVVSQRVNGRTTKVYRWATR